MATDRLEIPTRIKQRHHLQKGAALVELAFTLMVFLMFIFAIIEAAIIIFRWSSANEAVKAGVRTAIVSSPAGSLHGILECDAASDTYNPVMQFNCADKTEGGCIPVVNEMAKFSPLVAAENVTITYSCTGAENPEDGRIIPRVTVSMGAEYRSVLLGAFGIEATIPMAPSHFQSSRIAEDLYSN